MQRCRSTSTMPSARLNDAAVGHTSTQGGFAQCWHIIGRDVWRPVLMSLISILRIHCESVGLVPPDKPFSLLQAFTQSLQPSVQRVVSISMPQRTLELAPAVLPWAGENSNMPGATASAATPS